MRCFHRMLRGLGTRLGGAETQAGVILRHHSTGDYLASGARLAPTAAEAIVFESAAAASAIVARFACEPDSFVTVPVAVALTSAA